MSGEPETGPLYGVRLLKQLPIGRGAMLQALPSREDLDRVSQISIRTVAGYEVLLSHFIALAEKHAPELLMVSRR